MKTKIVLLSLLIASQAFSQSIEEMLAEDHAPQQTQVAVKSEVTSELVLAVQKLIAKKSTDHNVVYRAMETQDWTSALIQYPKAFESNSFYSSTNGIALLSILQIHAGLKVTGLETLFKISNPNEINPVMKKYLTNLVPADDLAWTMARVKWSNSWSTIFAPSVAIWIDSINFDSKSVDELTKISKELDADSKEKSFVDWHLAIKYALDDKAEKSAQLLTQIRKNPKSMINADLVQITAARLLFQNSYYDGAIKQYEKVTKGSNYWTQAQEEMGWSYIRKGQPQNAIAIGQSLIHPGLANQVSSESYFLMSLAQLKICDYPSVVSTLTDYSKNFKEKNTTLKNLVASTEDKNIEAFLNLKKTDTKVGSLMKNLPATIAMDRKLKALVQKQLMLEKESEISESLYAKSLALTGLQGHLETLKKNSESRKHAARSESVARIKFLATDELGHIKDNLNKLHIVEAEVIQQISIADQIASKAKDDGKVKVGSTGSKSKDAVSFPLEKEVWFDEIGSYKVNVKKACAAPAVQKEKTL